VWIWIFLTLDKKTIRGDNKLEDEKFANLGLAVLAATEQQINLKPEGSTFSPLTNLTVSGIITGALKLALVIAAIVFFFILVIGGIRWIISGGDKAQTEQARSQITAALVGLVIVLPRGQSPD